MKQSIKASRIVQKVRKDLEQDKRGPVTLSLNLSRWRAFKKACKAQGIPASVVAEKLMEEFVGSKGE